MAVTIKYNHDLSFRRPIAFWRMYRARDFKKRFTIEMIALAIFALATLAIWYAGSDAEFLIYVFYFTVVLSVYFIVRLLRAAMVALRVKPGSAASSERTFVFDDSGFSFGPMDEAGRRLETRWRDFDRVYFSDDVIYILCMGRRHWAAVDRHLVVEGSWDELVECIRKNVPKRQMVG